MGGDDKGWPHGEIYFYSYKRNPPPPPKPKKDWTKIGAYRPDLAKKK